MVSNDFQVAMAFCAFRHKLLLTTALQLTSEEEKHQNFERHKPVVLEIRLFRNLTHGCVLDDSGVVLRVDRPLLRGNGLHNV